MLKQLKQLHARHAGLRTLPTVTRYDQVRLAHGYSILGSSTADCVGNNCASSVLLLWVKA